MADVEGIRVHSIAQPYENSMKPRERLSAFFVFALHASLRARSLRGDVVFATSTPLTIAIPAIIATTGRSTPFVMEVRDLWPSVPIALGYLRNPVSRFLAKLLERIAYWKAVHIIALSQGMADGVAAAGVDRGKISVIPNLSDTKRFKAETVNACAFYEKHPQLLNRPFVLYSGTFGHVNGVEFMVDLAREYAVHDAHLAFVAIGDGARKKAVSSYAKENGVLNKNLFILDSVPKKALPDILAASLFCSSWVIPVAELEANSANKLFDAFAAGRPMLINHGGWQRDLLNLSGAGLALPTSDPKMAAKLLHKHVIDEEWLVSARNSSEQLGRTRFEVELLFEQFKQVLVSA
jgi:glycosyltransferase involved in cell wall biosynthesis